MIIGWVQEEKHYKYNELCAILAEQDEKANRLINKLKEFRVLIKKDRDQSKQDLSELVEEDIGIEDVEGEDNDDFYRFKFVGVIVIEQRLLICYPKYFSKSPTEDEMCQIIRVLKKYKNSKKQIVSMFRDRDENRSFNIIAALVYLMQDYQDNGVYTNTKDIYETNGLGEIMWDKTINETFALISNNRPYYVSLVTRKRINDEYDYFQRLHKCILTKASRDFKQAKLLNLFGLSELELSDEVIEDFGDTDYILYRIENELNTVFNTRKQLVLKLLYSYIGEGGSINDIDGVVLFGTGSFNLVWEDVCKKIFDNQLEESLPKLFEKLEIDLDYNYKNYKCLKDIIERPKWTITGSKTTDTFKLDSATIINNGRAPIKFIIIDAKDYNNPVLEPGKLPKGVPDIESVSKQYLYQLVFEDFIDAHNFEVSNCFVLPTEEDHVIDKKEVYLNMFRKLGLTDIKVRLFPAKLAYDCYLSPNSTMDISELLL